MKCCVLGWWADETKAYRLEGVMTGKLIRSGDMQFMKDDSPDDLAVIETQGKASTGAEITGLAPDTTVEGGGPSLVQLRAETQ